MDTSRNFYSVDTIKRTINGLAMVKLNTFHWHITDAQSMPLEFKSRPELTRLGAHSPHEVYKMVDVEKIIRYAKVRGVRVIPEFDTPAHVGRSYSIDFFLINLIIFCLR
jgi:hexosaminidase